MQDWLTQSQRSQAIQAQSKAALSKSAQAAPKAAVAAAIAAPLQGAVGVKLSYKEQRELEGLPALIEALETEQKELRETLSDSQLFAADPGKATALFERDAQIEEDLLAALERWEVLSGA